jgi:hypothetical protein
MTDALLVPTPVSSSAPDRTLRTQLDGRDYLLRLTWNGRESRWYLSVYDGAGDVLAASLKAVCNMRLLRRKSWDPRLPPGELYFIAQTADQSPPGIDELGEGKRVELTYWPAEEG